MAGDDIAYVNAHGTSTPLNDRAETQAIKLALGEHAGRIPVSSTKSAIGHLLGRPARSRRSRRCWRCATGSRRRRSACRSAEEGLDLDYVPGAARPFAPAAEGPALALSNSFGFGGHNAVLCLEAA